ncbi:lectin, galactoside-binding, soluble, 2b isoform X2 [Notolabrus celidotus]|uniref:lectin, galactoside-binding, soluble, 2b isoform X2 n=1 Tax=Notolabrus celidotus TaxID=1203425 RepID=UPI00148FCDD9|nr:lectin, galactoside-binding, soluble, 2b isoform X2 [Notolabrus celidotus]
MIVTDMTFKEGQEFKIRVKPSEDCSTFSINVGHDADNIAMHFNPRFDSGGDSSVIVFNSKSGGSWGDEQRDDHFPFVRGEECKFYLNLSMESFYIKLPDGTMVDFPNRLGDIKYKYFSIGGDARIVGIKIK